MLQFRLFGFPVFVQLFFFLTIGIIGPNDSIVQIALWIAIAFVGVLIHEMGHAWAARSFGLDPVIQLHGMGGVTSWQPTKSLNTWQRLVLSGSGPAIGIAVGLLVMAIGTAVRPESESALWWAFRYAYFVNLGWGVLNLFPVLPLDGGQIVSTLAERVVGPVGRTIATAASLLLLAGLSLWAIRNGDFFLTILAAILAVGNFQALLADRTKAPARPATREPSDAERSYDLARRLAAEGQTGDALEWLEVAIRSGLDNPAVLDADPAWSDLRSDPRFVNLRRRLSGS
jgi:stage IV sporulation protein FB